MQNNNTFPMNKDTNKYLSQEAEISNSKQPTLFNLSGFGKKKVEVKFTLEETSNDGGLLLLREVDKQIGLISDLADCIKDERHQSYVEHSITSMLSQRVMQIAAGYEDANDCNLLRNDGILKVCANQQRALATQPTMSRFENKVNSKELYKMANVFVDQFIASYESEPGIVILDPDDTDSLTYGQ